MNTDPIAERAREVAVATLDVFLAAYAVEPNEALVTRMQGDDLLTWGQLRTILAALTTESRPEVEALKREREGCARTAQRYVAAAGSMTNEETARGVMQAIRDRPALATPHPQTDAPSSGEAERLREAVQDALRDTLMEEYAVGEDEGIAAIVDSAIHAASLSDMRQWTWGELDALLSRMGYARCSAVGHQSYLARLPGATDAAKEGARSVVDTMSEAATIIGILRAALRPAPPEGARDSALEEADDKDAHARRYIRNWTPDHVMDYVARLEALRSAKPEQGQRDAD